MATAAQLAKKEAAGDYSHLKNKKGELVAKPLPQPTLPNLSVDDDLDGPASMRTRGSAPSTYTAQSDYYPEHKGAYPADYPPMPAYNQPYSNHQVPGGYLHYNASVPAVYDDHQPYDDETGSTAHLAFGAAPIAHGQDGHSSVNSYGPVADLHNVYYGEQHQTHTGYDTESQRHNPSQSNEHYDHDRTATRTPAPLYEAYPNQPQADPYANNPYDTYDQPRHDPYGQQQYHHGGNSGSENHGYTGHAF
jgi:hypothetical protein